MGEHHILTGVHVPKQVLAIMDFAQHEDIAKLCSTDVNEIA